MPSKHLSLRLAAVVAAACAAVPAQAGGPLYLQAPGKPYVWDMSRPVPVYTDVGGLCDTNPDYPYAGCLTQAQAVATVRFGFAQWTNVATSNFQAQVVGNFADIGLGDVTGANAGQVVGSWNGGGYHVMFDADSSIVQDFFGAPPGVLGISSPEWADDDGNITESWAVINVSSVPEGDDGRKAAGVMTHEFGHGINLAHSQTNGHITFIGSPWYWIPWAPRSCKAPYDVSPIEDFDEYNQWIDTVMIPSTETMYPFLNPDYTAEAQSTVDRRDDIVAVSNLYPAAGWPASHGSISGQIQLKDGRTGLTGVNVVARNVADPIGDAITVMSGDLTQGAVGPDGRYTINGLTPGAQYVLYVEEIIAGGFPTPPATLPSLQEYYNGARESTDAAQDDPCNWSTVAAAAGTRTTANIAFNGIARAPKMVMIPVEAATDVDNSGRRVVGTFGGQAGWRYDTFTGEFDVFDSASAPRIARDGLTVTGDRIPELPPWEGGRYVPGFWNFNTGWSFMNLPPNEPGCDGYVFATWDLDERASKAVGLFYKNGCPGGSWSPGGKNKFYAGAWTARTGLVALSTPDYVLAGAPECAWSSPDGCEVYGSRANAVSGNGRIVVGHVDAGGWRGASWIDGKFSLIGKDDPKGWVGSANDINRDGTVVVGGLAGDDGFGWGNQAYIWSPTRGTRTLGNLSVPCEQIDPWLCDFSPTVTFPTEGFGVSNKGDIVIGRAGNFFSGYLGFIWMEGLGMLDFNEFLQGQGVMEGFTTQLFGPSAVSGDGKTIVGWGAGTRSYVSFALTLDQVWVCSSRKSQLVGFPGGMLSQLSRGATIGLCAADRPIAP